MENIDQKIEMAKEAVKELRQAKALADSPVNEVKENRSRVFADVQKAMRDATPVTLGGTGNINIVRELQKVLTAKKDVLGKFRYFNGPDANTKIPVWASDLGRAHEVGEAGTWTETQNGALGVKDLYPKAFCKTIPVSAETLKLSAVDFEAELYGIIADVYADTIAYEVFNAAGTGAFKNIYSGNQNKVEVKTKDTVCITDLAKLALEVSDKMDNAEILVNSNVYSDITAADASAKEKAWMKELIEKKSIEGVPVRFTSYADKTGAKAFAIAGNFQNYAIAIADQIVIEAKKTVGSLVTNYDVSMFLAGDVIVPQNFFELVNKE